MSYSNYLKPRPETISEDGIEGIIDLANLAAGSSGKIEANPEALFNLTYPTSDNPKSPQSEDIVIHKGKQLAMIKGRVKTKSTGEAVAKLYKHGSLSLMEMLTPWVVLET